MNLTRSILFGVTLGCVAVLHPASAAAASTAAPAKAPPAAAVETATFAGGCFWSTESSFEGQPGVISAVSGYMGGRQKNPTYDEVSSGGTGYAECVQVKFDPSRTSYAKLVDLFWHSIDPTQADGQNFDIGTQYRTAIFYADEKQHQIAEQSKKQIEASRVLKAPIATAIVPAGPFYAAEGYHQDYARKNALHYQAYRMGSGKDRRLEQIWGKAAAKPLGH